MIVGVTAPMIRILRIHVIHAIIFEATWMDGVVVDLAESSLPSILLELFFFYLLGSHVLAGTLNSIRFANSLILGRPKSTRGVISLPVASLDALKSRHFPAQRLSASKPSIGRPVDRVIHLETATPWRFRDWRLKLLMRCLRTGLSSLCCHVQCHRSIIKQGEFRVGYIVSRLKTLWPGALLIFHHI